MSRRVLILHRIPMTVHIPIPPLRIELTVDDVIGRHKPRYLRIIMPRIIEIIPGLQIQFLRVIFRRVAPSLHLPRTRSRRRADTRSVLSADRNHSPLPLRSQPGLSSKVAPRWLSLCYFGMGQSSAKPTPQTAGSLAMPKVFTFPAASDTSIILLCSSFAAAAYFSLYWNLLCADIFCKH